MKPEQKIKGRLIVAGFAIVALLAVLFAKGGGWGGNLASSALVAPPTTEVPPTTVEPPITVDFDDLISDDECKNFTRGTDYEVVVDTGNYKTVCNKMIFPVGSIFHTRNFDTVLNGGKEVFRAVTREYYSVHGTIKSNSITIPRGHPAFEGKTDQDIRTMLKGYNFCIEFTKGYEIILRGYAQDLFLESWDGRYRENFQCTKATLKKINSSCKRIKHTYTPMTLDEFIDNITTEDDIKRQVNLNPGPFKYEYSQSECQILN